MTVAVVYAMSTTGRLALEEAVKEARLRDQALAVLHVVGSPGQDQAEAYRRGISEEVEKAVAPAGDLGWHLHLRSAASEAEVNDVLLGLVEEVAPALVVVGARRRSPIGKALMGSTAQAIVLGVNSPVLVVKPS